MPTLNWIGKEAVVNHDKEVPFRLLKKVKSISVGSSQNLIIHGDNLEALKALMPYYTGKIDVVYIDPPYNTGNENWVYNDKVNSPKIQKWLGKTVGGKIEDLCRHDKWLCMMYPRIKLLKDLMSDEGVIFISIGEDEVAQLKLLLDNEIFGEENFISYVPRVAKTASNKGNYFAPSVDFILVYAKNIQKLSYFKDEVDISLYKKEDAKGKYRDDIALYQSALDPMRGCSNQRYFIECPDGSLVIPPGDVMPSKKENAAHIKPETKLDKVWRWSYPTYLDRKHLLVFKKTTRSPLLDQDGKQAKYNIYTKSYFEERAQQGTAPRNFLSQFINRKGADLIKQMGIKFDYSKPFELVKYLIKITDKRKDILVLDSMAGSGTTAHAVLDLNKDDGGCRKFILIEMEDDVAKDITAERVKRSIKKYKYKDGFEYCELSKPLFDEEGQIEDTCDFDQFATYIYFTETQTNIDPAKVSGNCIGEYAETEYYLIYKEKGENVLSKSFLKKLRKTNGTKVIYADKCLLDEAILEKHNIIFKQIPYEVKVY